MGAPGADNLLASKSLVRRKNRAELQKEKESEKGSDTGSGSGAHGGARGRDRGGEGRRGIKTFNFKGDAVSENGSSISVEVIDGNRRGREAAEAHPGEPMVFAVVSGTTKVEIDDARRRSPR